MENKNSFSSIHWVMSVDFNFLIFSLWTFTKDSSYIVVIGLSHILVKNCVLQRFFFHQIEVVIYSGFI